MEAKVCRGTWCMAFGFEPKLATMEQVAKVLSAFEYDGIELGGFFDHCTVERFPDKASRSKLQVVAERRARPRDRGHRARPVRRPLPPALGDRLAGGLRRVHQVLRGLPRARRRHGDPGHARRSGRRGAASVRRRLRPGLGARRHHVPAPRRAWPGARRRHALGARVAAAVQQALGDGEDARGRRPPELQADVRHGPLPGLRRHRAQPRPAGGDAAESDRVHQDAAEGLASATSTCATPT